MQLLFNINSSLNLVERIWHFDKSYNSISRGTCKIINNNVVVTIR